MRGGSRGRDCRLHDRRWLRAGRRCGSCVRCRRHVRRILRAGRRWLPGFQALHESGKPRICRAKRCRYGAGSGCGLGRRLRICGLHGETLQQGCHCGSPGIGRACRGAVCLRSGGRRRWACRGRHLGGASGATCSGISRFCSAWRLPAGRLLCGAGRRRRQPRALRRCGVGRHALCRGRVAGMCCGVFPRQRCGLRRRPRALRRCGVCRHALCRGRVVGMSCGVFPRKRGGLRRRPRALRRCDVCQHALWSWPCCRNGLCYFSAGAMRIAPPATRFAACATSADVAPCRGLGCGALLRGRRGIAPPATRFAALWPRPISRVVFGRFAAFAGAAWFGLRCFAARASGIAPPATRFAALRRRPMCPMSWLGRIAVFAARATRIAPPWPRALRHAASAVAICGSCVVVWVAVLCCEGDADCAATASLPFGDTAIADGEPLCSNCASSAGKPFAVVGRARSRMRPAWHRLRVAIARRDCHCCKQTHGLHQNLSA